MNTNRVMLFLRIYNQSLKKIIMFFGRPVQCNEYELIGFRKSNFIFTKDYRQKLKICLVHALIKTYT